MASPARGNLTFLPPPRDRAPESSGFAFPGPRDRVTVNGMTGSGKSVFAFWLFAESADFHRKPWIILDYKQEAEEIPSLGLDRKMFESLRADSPLPKKPGVYVVRHNAREGTAPIVDLLWRVYERTRIGLFLDEATMVPELRGEGNSGGPFQSILSQGRSKEIPVYVLAQRPAFVNKMVFSENNFYSCFKLKLKDDYKKILDDIPEDSRDYRRVWKVNTSLPPHWSRWYDAQSNRSFLLRPCPSPNEIVQILATRLDKAREGATI